METERRRHKRRKFTYYMRVVDADTLQLIGHLTDISPLGIRVDSERPMPVNRNYRLRVDLTPDMANKNYIVFNGHSKWCGVDRLVPNSYNIGFEVNTLSHADTAILKRLYENYGSDSMW